MKTAHNWGEEAMVAEAERLHLFITINQEKYDIVNPLYLSGKILFT